MTDMYREYVGACLGLSHSTRRRGEIPLKPPAPFPSALPITAALPAYVCCSPGLSLCCRSASLIQLTVEFFWFFSGGPSES